MSASTISVVKKMELIGILFNMDVGLNVQWQAICQKYSLTFKGGEKNIHFLCLAKRPSGWQVIDLSSSWGHNRAIGTYGGLLSFL